MTQPNLFDIGEPLPIADQRPVDRRCTAGINGRGPAGETCRSCRRLVRTSNGGRVFLKCGLCRAAWTNGPATDIRARWPACEHWESQPG